MNLITYLKNTTDFSKEKIKSLLKNKQVLVNDKIETKATFILKETDTVRILKGSSYLPFPILYEDSNIIAIDKPSGILTISTFKEKEKTVYHLVSTYLKTKNKNQKVFIIHRLDKDTSGVLLLAKSKKVQEFYQNNWNQVALKREYIALVSGHLKKDTDTIIDYLKIDKNGQVKSQKDGKIAITNYQKIKEYKNSTLVKINIQTGRKHQIRLALKKIGNPIVGDKKYGITKNKEMCLKASLLKILTIDNKELTIKTIQPKWNKL